MRSAIVVVFPACLGLWAVGAAGQEERPQITPGEMKVGKKKNVGPRAVGVLEMSASGKKTLVPIAIRVNGQFWDASAYKADPIPMALDPGTVYEAERAGSSLGLFTVNSALHSTAANAQTPWIATGSWIAAGSEMAKTEVKAETAPVGIDASDQPPRLTRDPAKIARSAATPSSSAPSAPTPPAKPSGSGDEPPRLTKGVSSPPDSTPPAATAPASTGPGSTSSTAPSATVPKTPDDGKSSDAKSADAKPDAAKPEVRASVPASDSGASAGARPTLRRGKPAGSLPDDDVPGYSKPGPGASSTPATGAAQAAQAAADKLVDIVPAISDAGGPDPHSFAFEWLKDDEADRKKQVVQLATEQVRAYVEARAKALIAPTSTSPAARRTSSANPASAKPATKLAAKTPSPILENVQMKTYDLWTNNQPVIVFSAEAHLPPPPAAGTSQADADAQLKYSILIVAYPDIYNNLHKVYVGVTDKYHLDLTPRLELIDAVDADGDGRGELLFREISDSGNGWVIYRATADKLWKMFDSLHPE